MSYEIECRGGLYPEGRRATTKTAAGARQRYQALKLACDTATVRTDIGEAIPVSRPLDEARHELF